MSFNSTGSRAGSPPNLALSSSLSTASVTVQCTSTPKAEIITLASIFLEAGLSPPAKSYKEPLNGIIAIANRVLKLANKGRWAELTDYERVLFAFLIWKEQYTILQEKGHNEVVAAKMMVDALNPASDAYKAAEPFIQKGGDKDTDDDGNYYTQFLKKHPEWRDDENALSIFTMTTDFGGQMLPFIRFQTNSSMVCFLISAANAILYYMILTTGTKRDEAVVQYGLNIGRFMRNNFTNEQVYEMVFHRNGGYPQQILESLLVHSTNKLHPHKPKTSEYHLETMYLQGDVRATAAVFFAVSAHLVTYGPLLVCDFRTFPKYTDTSITTFHGEWHDWKDPDAEKDVYHALLITGVRRTKDGSMGGAVFQMQDSLPGRPFVNIGLDLIRSMGVDDVVQINKGVVFQGTSAENCFDDIPIAITSGRPRGVPLTTGGEAGSLSSDLEIPMLGLDFAKKLHENSAVWT